MSQPSIARSTRTPPLFDALSREAWASLRDDIELPLSPEELPRLRATNDTLDVDEVTDVYLPLCRLLALQMPVIEHLHDMTSRFLRRPRVRVPFVIGIAGSVAVGKTTTARLLQALLARWPEPRDVALLTTDGFLLPNDELRRRGLLERKGFPESYDVRKLHTFLAQAKSGEEVLETPVYSHLLYDVVPHETATIESPDVLIVEGLNVLQTDNGGARPRTFVSDYLDYSIYVDAAEQDLREWYVERFMVLQRIAFEHPRSYFHAYADLDEDEARAVATAIWERTNGPNLRSNIRPTLSRADVVLQKGSDHAVERVLLRRF
jgi:type I pantothenate kinase